MNNWSFMRIVDENKIEQVEQAAIELVVQHGYGGASVSIIAKQAKVSKGYLYRFYKNKQNLVQALLTKHINVIVERIEECLRQSMEVETVISDMIAHIFKIAETHPNHIKFIYVLLHDYSFQLEINQKLKIRALAKEFYTLGVKQKRINEAVTEEEIFTVSIIYPIEFINLRFKKFFSHSVWDQQDIERVTTFCINALKH